jgi:putative membrane protein
MAIENSRYQPTSRWVIVFSLVVTLLGTGVLYVLFSCPRHGEGLGRHAGGESPALLTQ